MFSEGKSFHSSLSKVQRHGQADHTGETLPTAAAAVAAAAAAAAAAVVALKPFCGLLDASL